MRIKATVLGLAGEGCKPEVAAAVEVVGVVVEVVKEALSGQHPS